MTADVEAGGADRPRRWRVTLQSLAQAKTVAVSPRSWNSRKSRQSRRGRHIRTSIRRPDRGRRDRLRALAIGEPGFTAAIAVGDRGFRALFIVEDEIDRQARAAGLGRVRRVAP